MGNIKETFMALRNEGEKPFIPFLMAGDPTLDLTKKIVLEAEKQGADIVELGIPYATPLADGPTVQQAGQRSLKHDTNLEDIFQLVAQIREDSQIPIVLMGYYNSIFNYGLKEFVAKCETVGVDGVIIPDLPLGEGQELRKYSTDLDIILLVAPTSNRKRIKQAANASQGFIYAVSTLGTTGTRTEISNQVEEVVSQVKELTTTPVAVGFGIAKQEHVREIAKFADGIIVGSAIIKQIEANLNLLPEKENNLINKVGHFIAQLKEPLISNE
ncbi:tryptophan synthase, alpha subunit [Halobacteroides halobius DSM 5150]|uniref:Tryptophan synthase alpha chain n=1 Tax=Halobacteroides halobius (strain ATCC 35273 / DSM 5150 / MD-1) TaxID=748449 RepID=L0K781_HALHC|nr:tryptophan synthase subunit alpha [Halobacteroides halobius]AGB40390.1 tryptophan synthase, alpha subunit [Halobacteroides halobius DSM 5150]